MTINLRLFYNEAVRLSMDKTGNLYTFAVFRPAYGSELYRFHKCRRLCGMQAGFQQAVFSSAAEKRSRDIVSALFYSLYAALKITAGSGVFPPVAEG